MNTQLYESVPLLQPKIAARKQIDELAKTYAGLKWIGVATSPWTELVSNHASCRHIIFDRKSLLLTLSAVPPSRPLRHPRPFKVRDPLHRQYAIQQLLHLTSRPRSRETPLPPPQLARTLRQQLRLPCVFPHHANPTLRRRQARDRNFRLRLAHQPLHHRRKEARSERKIRQRRYDGRRGFDVRILHVHGRKPRVQSPSRSRGPGNARRESRRCGETSIVATFKVLGGKIKDSSARVFETHSYSSQAGFSTQSLSSNSEGK